MERRVELLEFELMLLGRHMQMTARGKRYGNLVDRSAYMLLSRLRVEGPMSIGQLGEAFGLDVSTLNRQTAAMVREGLAERIADPDGGVARKFRITEQGERSLDKERATIVDGMGQMLSAWTDDDIGALTALLKRLNIDIENRKGQSWPRP